MAAGRLEKSLDYLDWVFFAHAVLTVYEENKAREGHGAAVTGVLTKSAVDASRANADTWTWHSLRRQQLFNRALSEWCETTGLDSSWFPYSEDAVCRTYFRFRKRNDQEIADFRKEVLAALRKATISGEIVQDGQPSLFS